MHYSLHRLSWAMAALVAFVGTPAALPSEITIIEFQKPVDGEASAQLPPNGIFRDEGDSPERQSISNDFVDEALPTGETKRFLRLAYLVSSGTYNGYWVKPERLDASAVRKGGSLVLRVRPGKPATTSVFKVEVKSKDAQGKSHVYPAIVRLTREHFKAVEAKGYCDVALALDQFVSREDDLRGLSEVVIVFEHARVTAARGVLLVNSIRLVGNSVAPGESLAIIDELERKAFAYFKDHAHPATGLVRDRAPNFDKGGHLSDKASIAATGYYLSILPEAVRRGWMSKAQARREAAKVLAAAAKAEHHDGILYHFVDRTTGKRWKQSETSTLDTAILLNGVMVAAVYFPELTRETNLLLDRVDWPSYLVERQGKKLLSMGWHPDKGRLGPVDVRTSEAAMPLLLAIGSKRSIDTECWYNTDVSYREIEGQKVLHGHLPLFVSYYGLCWADLRGLIDRQGTDLCSNSRLAALANRSFCRNVGAKQNKTYRMEGGGFWGISAGDAATGYVAPGPLLNDADGTVWPMTALAALPWASDELNVDISQWRASKQWPKIIGKYGIAPFNQDTDWIAPEIIGIDLGAFLLNVANHRNRTIWDLWMQHSVAKRGLSKVGLTKQTREPERRQPIRRVGQSRRLTTRNELSMSQLGCTFSPIRRACGTVARAEAECLFATAS